MYDGSLYVKVVTSLPMTIEAFPNVYEKIAKRFRADQATQIDYEIMARKLLGLKKDCELRHRSSK